MSDAPPPPAGYESAAPQPSGYSQPVQPAGYYGQPVQQAVPGTNVLAIISLVISILGFNIIAIILGAVGLSQIKKSGEKGRGLAIAGIWIGAVSFALGIIFVIVFVVILANVAVTQTS